MATTRTPPCAGNTRAGRCSSRSTEEGNRGEDTKLDEDIHPLISYPCSPRDWTLMKSNAWTSSFKVLQTNGNIRDLSVIKLFLSLGTVKWYINLFLSLRPSTVLMFCIYRLCINDFVELTQHSLHPPVNTYRSLNDWTATTRNWIYVKRSF